MVVRGIDRDPGLFPADYTLDDRSVPWPADAIACREPIP